MSSGLPRNCDKAYSQPAHLRAEYDFETEIAAGRVADDSSRERKSHHFDHTGTQSAGVHRPRPDIFRLSWPVCRQLFCDTPVTPGDKSERPIMVHPISQLQETFSPEMSHFFSDDLSFVGTFGCFGFLLILTTDFTFLMHCTDPRDVRWWMIRHWATIEGIEIGEDPRCRIISKSMRPTSWLDRLREGRAILCDLEA